MIFKDRKEAGEKLAQALKKYQGENAVIFALPRGGVILGSVISKKLNLPLNLVIPRKIGHPDQPEYAIAAVTEHGDLIESKETEFIDKGWFKNRVEEEIKEAKRRIEVYLQGKDIKVKRKIAIIVDDGIATGLTIKAAILDLKNRGAKKIVIAVPIAPQEVVDDLKKEVEEVIVLEKPKIGEFLGAVGNYYSNFPQISDEEVIKILS